MKLDSFQDPSSLRVLDPETVKLDYVNQIGSLNWIYLEGFSHLLSSPLLPKVVGDDCISSRETNTCNQIMSIKLYLTAHMPYPFQCVQGTVLRSAGP